MVQEIVSIPPDTVSPAQEIINEILYPTTFPPLPTLPPRPTIPPLRLNIPPPPKPHVDNIFDHLYGWLNRALDFLTRGIVSVSDLLLIASWVVLFKVFRFVKGQTVFHFVKDSYRKYANKQDDE